MTHILLDNGDLVLTLTEETRHLTPNSLNYHAIKKLLTESPTEQAILDLLNEDTPDGIWYAGLLHDDLYIQHITDMTITNWERVTEFNKAYRLVPPTIIGSFTSRENLVNAFPEYFI